MPILDAAFDRARQLVKRIPEPLKRPVVRLAERAPLSMRRAIGSTLGTSRDRWERRVEEPWRPTEDEAWTAPRMCNICRWSGDEFADPGHVEAAKCPVCGSLARDRFQLWCVQQLVEPTATLRILETSPRMDRRYRRAMRAWFGTHVCSDYDQRAHRGDLRLDLQDIDLPDGGIDLMLSAHVLEHVPDTDRAIAEIHRILAAPGRLLLQVPVLQERTAPPSEPEFHGDDTPVFWRFGYDLAVRLEGAGFAVDALVTEPFVDAVRTGDRPASDAASGGEFDVDGLYDDAPNHEFTVVASTEAARRLGFDPPHMFLTWSCVKRV